MSTRIFSMVGVWLAFAAALLERPALSAACSACVAGRRDNEIAFVGTTGLLSVLPLVMIGGVVCWLVVRARAGRLEDERAEREAAEHASPRLAG